MNASVAGAVMPRVSVVIAAYNAAATIEETLNSVAAQTFRDFELIVVDDGSSDATPELLQGYAASRPWMSWVRQANAGASAAREHGIALAQAEWIAFLDADDLWLAHKLELQVALAAQRPSVGFICTNAVDFLPDRDLPLTQFQQKAPARGQVVKDLFARNFVNTSTVLVRKAALQEAGGFDRHKKVNEDFDLWLRLALLVEFEYIDDILVRRRILPTSLTRANELACFRQDLAIIDQWVAERPDLFDTGSLLVRRRRALILSRLAYQLLAEQRFAEARGAYWQAVKLGQRNAATLARLAASAFPPAARLFWRLKAMRAR
jgi:glycosyltransferase involved in cell wall biosynthesis